MQLDVLYPGLQLYCCSIALQGVAPSVLLAAATAPTGSSVALVVCASDPRAGSAVLCWGAGSSFSPIYLYIWFRAQLGLSEPDAACYEKGVGKGCFSWDPGADANQLFQVR